MKTYKVTVGNDGTRWYNEEGQTHREGDLPAFESNSGNKYWYTNGKLHREGGLPAIESAYGNKYWYTNGKLHREGGLPAIESAYGDKWWYINGERVTESEAIEYFKPKVKEVEWKTFLMEGLINDVYIQEIMRFKSIENAKELYPDATIKEIKLNFDIL